jgi:hypothetical protein
MANDRSKIFFNVLALENILVALTREIGDGPCFLYIKFSWIGVFSKPNCIYQGKMGKSRRLNFHHDMMKNLGSYILKLSNRSLESKKKFFAFACGRTALCKSIKMKIWLQKQIEPIVLGLARLHPLIAVRARPIFLFDGCKREKYYYCALIISPLSTAQLKILSLHCK